MTIRCPMCGMTLQVDDAQAGMRARVVCEGCKRTLSIRLPSSLAESEAASPPAPTDELAFEAPPANNGELAEASVPEVLARLWREKFTGGLEIDVPSGKHDIRLRGGDIVSYRTSNPEFGLLGVLVTMKRLAAEDRDRLGAEGLDDEPLADRVVEEGIIDRGRLTSVRTRGLKLLLAFLAQQVEGRFDAEKGASGPRLLKVVMEKLLVDVMRESSSVESIDRALPDDGRRLAFRPEGMALFQKLPLKPEEQGLLMLVNGKRALGDIVAESGVGEETARRALFVLFAFDILEAGEAIPGYVKKQVSRVEPAAEPTAELSDDAEEKQPMVPVDAEPQREPVAPAATPQPVESATAASTAGGGDFSFSLDVEEAIVHGGSPQTELDPVRVEAEPVVEVSSPEPPPGDDRVLDAVVEEEAPVATATPAAAERSGAVWLSRPPESDLGVLVEELREFQVGLADKDHYEILQVPESADLPLIKESYFGFARRYHPDKFFSLEDEAVKELVDAVYTKVTVAFETIKDPQRRAEYERTERKPEEAASGFENDIIQAELKYQDAHAAFMHKDYKTTVEMVGWAIKLNPDKAKYHALLGRVRSQRDPGVRDLDEAIEAYRRAADMEPKSPSHRIMIGRCYLAKEKTKEAKKYFQYALLVDADNHEAKRELRLLQMREKSGMDGSAAKAAAKTKPTRRPAKKGKPEKKKGGLFGRFLGRG